MNAGEAKALAKEREKEAIADAAKEAKHWLPWAEKWILKVARWRDTSLRIAPFLFGDTPYKKLLMEQLCLFLKEKGYEAHYWNEHLKISWENV